MKSFTDFYFHFAVIWNANINSHHQLDDSVRIQTSLALITLHIQYISCNKVKCIQCREKEASRGAVTICLFMKPHTQQGSPNSCFKHTSGNPWFILASTCKIANIQKQHVVLHSLRAAYSQQCHLSKAARKQFPRCTISKILSSLT